MATPRLTSSSLYSQPRPLAHFYLDAPQVQIPLLRCSHLQLRYANGFIMTPKRMKYPEPCGLQSERSHYHWMNSRFHNETWLRLRNGNMKMCNGTLDLRIQRELQFSVSCLWLIQPFHSIEDCPSPPASLWSPEIQNAFQNSSQREVAVFLTPQSPPPSIPQDIHWWH